MFINALPTEGQCSVPDTMAELTLEEMDARQKMNFANISKSYDINHNFLIMEV